MTNALKLLVLLVSIGCCACGGGGDDGGTGSSSITAISAEPGTTSHVGSVTAQSSDDDVVFADAGAEDVSSSDRVADTGSSIGLCRE